MASPQESLVPRPHPAPLPGKPEAAIARRELFWNNVIREMLTALSVMRLSRDSQVYEPEAESHLRDTFDGRLAVITSLGARIPIAEVYPLFACSVNTSAEQRELSEQVQCTVFQIRTPAGEVYTLPVHEIRSFHALTPELLAQIEAQAQQDAAAAGHGDEAEGDGSNRPFGFAAFTSLSRSAKPATGSDAPA
ncbi:MAG: hypothetical protein IT439_12890 [Phycisphaerales bacterium]|nr:hypothetical protein [Phycisphaerales bacterium]